MDKIKFTLMVQWVITCLRNKDYFEGNELAKLDDMITAATVTKPNQCVEACKVDDLLKQLNAPNGFIEAIKAYRVLTGAGLKESKEAIERYRTVPNFVKEPSSD